MKILYLLTQDLNSPSGSGRYGPLMSQMVRHGHEVSLVALHSNFTALKIKRFIENGIDIRYVSQMHVKKLDNQKSYFSTGKLISVTTSAMIKMLYEALKIPADIIHICKPHPMNSLPGYLIHKFRDSRLFLDCDDYEAGSNRFSSEWQRKVLSGFENWTPKKVEHITTHSSFLVNHLLSLGIPEERISIIPNGVDIQRFDPPSAELINTLRIKYRLSNRKVVLFVGSLSLSNHPVDLLLRAFKKLNKQYPDTVLFVVGGGEDYNNLIELAAKLEIQRNVIFTGRVSADEVVNYYYLGDVSVDPVNDDEAAKGRCPLKLFESWASGVPFVTADVGDRRQLLGSPPAGLLAEPGNADSLAFEISRVLENPELANSLRTRGFELAHRYSWESIGNKLEEIYQSIMNNK